MIFNQKWLGCAAFDKKYGEFFDVKVPGNIQKDYAEFMGWGDINCMNNCKKYEEILIIKAIIDIIIGNHLNKSEIFFIVLVFSYANLVNKPHMLI